MPDNIYKSNYTGATIDSATSKAIKLPSVTTSDSGKILTTNGANFEVETFSDIFNANFDSISDNLIDTTLTDANKAANSKTVGDNFLNECSLIQNFTPKVGTGTFTWESGSINTSGNNIDSTARARMKYRGTSARRRIIMFSDPSYEFRVYVYTAETGGSFVKYMPEGRWCDASLGVLEDPARDGGAYYRIVVRRKDGAVIDATERNNISDALVFRYITDTTLTEAGVPADAQLTGNYIRSTINDPFPVDLFPNSAVVSWNQGDINPSDGGNWSSSENYLRCNRLKPGTRCKLFISGDYDIRVFTYTGQSSGYVGCSDWTNGEIGIIIDPYKDGGEWYRYSIAKRPRAAITAEEKTAITSNFKCYSATDATLSLAGYPADAKAISARITSLDQIAWGNKSYRDIFIEGDLLNGRGRFEDSNFDRWNYVQGSPVLTIESNKQVMECTSEGTSCRVGGPVFSVPAAGKRDMFAACRVNVLSMTSAGNRGFGIVDANGEGSGGLSFSKGCKTSVTNGYVTVGGCYSYTASGISTGYSDRLYIGNYSQSSSEINGIARYSNAVWINLYNVFGSNAPTENELLVLYEQYVEYLNNYKISNSGGLNENIKNALLTLLQDIPYTTPSAQAHYNALVNALDI